MSLSDNERAAIERLRRLDAGERSEVVYAHEQNWRHALWAVDHDNKAVADLYLAEHPADDAEPVTEEWLRSVGFKRDTWHPFQLDCDSDIDIRCTESDLVLGHRSDEWDVKLNPTRGDVRLLCRALNIPLQEAE